MIDKEDRDALVKELGALIALLSHEATPYVAKIHEKEQEVHQKIATNPDRSEAERLAAATLHKGIRTLKKLIPKRIEEIQKILGP